MAPSLPRPLGHSRDHELVQCCLAGDQQAMRQLMDVYRKLVLELSLRILGHRQDAEDATQETFVRVFENLPKWDSSRRFRPWLLAIAANRCRSMLSKRNTKPLVQELSVDYPEPDRDLQSAQQLNEEVVRALRRLRLPHREAFLLFHQGELSYEEISDIMQRPIGTVKTWVHRARRDIQRQLVNRQVLTKVDHAM